MVRNISNADEFILVGNSLAVDFVNTQRIEDGATKELLTSGGDIFRWARAAGLAISKAMIRAAFSEPLSQDALRLRAAIRRLFEALLDGEEPPAGDIAVLNEFLLRPKGGAGLVYQGGKFVSVRAPIMTVTDILDRVADDACAILTSEDASRLRRCASDRCILLFVDRSRTGGRRWCSMAICGNRAKAATHYRRAHE